MSNPILPISAAAKRLLKHEQVQAFLETNGSHEMALQRFFTAAGLKSWDDVLALRRGQAMRAVEALRRAGGKPATVGHAIGAAKALYRYLLDMEVIETTPLAELRVKSKSEVPMWNVLTPEQADKIVDAIDGEFALRDRAVVAAILDHGFRATELCALTWGMVREEKTSKGAVGHVLTMVGGIAKKKKDFRFWLKPRTFELAWGWFVMNPVNTTVADIRGGHIDESVPFIALNRENTPMSRYDVYEIVTRATAKVGSKATPHGLRATFLSRIIKTKDIETARQLGRHDSISTTQRYHRYDILGEEPE